MLAFFVRLILRPLFRVAVHGSIAPAPRMLIVANHQSFLDGVLMGAFLPIQPYWLVHSTIAAQWHFKILLKVVPHLVVDTNSPFAVKAAIALIESGRPVVMFPEGRITVTGSLMKIYEGAAMVAAKSEAAVVPVHIDGAVYATLFSRMTGDFPQRLFPRITLHVHPPRRVPMPEARTGKERRAMAADQLRRIMQESAFLSRQPGTIYSKFLDAVELYGRGRKVLEDIRFQQESYGHVLKASLALGRLLSRHTEEREVVGVLLPNVTTTIALLLGLFATRRVPAMMNYTAGAAGMQSAIVAARIRLLVTSRAFLEKGRFQAMVEKLAGVRILYLEDLRPQFTLGDKLWLISYALRFPRRAARLAAPHDPAVVLFTSGSEGKPKGVVLSHDAILANIAQIRAVIEFSSKDKFLSAMPMFHSFGLTVGALLPLHNGCRIFLYPSPLHYRVVPEMAYDRDCTVLFATNTFLANYAKRANPMDFRSIRYIVAGAEKLTAEVRQTYAEKFGLRIIEGYGATECSPVISANTPAKYKAGTVGEILPGIESRLEPVPGIDQGGLLHVKGPNLMLGYWREDKPGVLEPPQSVFGEGWYPTGDIAYLDEEGFLHLVGRMKRFAKVAGEMVSLEVVEKVASHASPARIHAAIAVPDSSRGEVIVLYTQDAGLRRDQLQQAARTLGAPELAVPRRITAIDKIPLLGNGKKDYVTLQRMAAS